MKRNYAGITEPGAWMLDRGAGDSLGKQQEVGVVDGWRDARSRIDERDRRQHVEDRGAIWGTALAHPEDHGAAVELDVDRERISRELVRDEAVRDEAASRERDEQRRRQRRRQR